MQSPARDPRVQSVRKHQKLHKLSREPSQFLKITSQFLKTMDYEYNFNFLNSLPLPVFCPIYDTRQFTLDPPCPDYERREKARDASFPLERFKYSKCKCLRPITDYPLDSRDFRAATCSACHARRRDEYLEQKGEPVSKEGRARRFRRA